VIATAKLPSMSVSAVPRFEQPDPPQQRSTATNGRKALPVTLADDPARPEAGEIEIDAAAAVCAVVIWSRRRVSTRVRDPAITRAGRCLALATLSPRWSLSVRAYSPRLIDVLGIFTPENVSFRAPICNRDVTSR
jgi:hypothetical protein